MQILLREMKACIKNVLVQKYVIDKLFEDASFDIMQSANKNRFSKAQNKALALLLLLPPNESAAENSNRSNQIISLAKLFFRSASSLNLT
jgi:hypothetical protein